MTTTYHGPPKVRVVIPNTRECETVGCHQPGQIIVADCHTGRPDWWMCGRCAEEWTALHTPAGHVDGVLYLFGLAALFLGAALALGSATLMITAVHLDAQLTWIRWAGVAGGIAAMVAGRIAMTRTVEL